MRKLQKSVTITTFPSRAPLNLRLLFIFVSNARTRSIGIIRIKCFTTFCIRCNRCPWSARTRWARRIQENSLEYLKTWDIFIFRFFSSQLSRQNCRGTDKSAISVCFSTECASYNGNHPIRYCQQCHSIRHNNRRGGDHVYHTALPHISQLDPQGQTYMVQAIVRQATIIVSDNCCRLR